MTALVSFDRVFEVLDLKPLIAERPDAAVLPAQVPSAAGAGRAGDRVRPRVVPLPDGDRGLAGLAGVDRAGRCPSAPAPRPGCCTTSASARRPASSPRWSARPARARPPSPQLVARLYDPTEGAVRIGGDDLRDVTLESLHDVVGVVTQDAHLFHDTIRANLLYARPAATELELHRGVRGGADLGPGRQSCPTGWTRSSATAATGCPAARSSASRWPGCCSRRPSVVVLDEATAHLDSESEAAVQRALKSALAGRTSLVIAHRLSTIREADQILVVERGPDRRARHARGAARRGRPVRRPVPHPVRRVRVSVRHRSRHS